MKHIRLSRTALLTAALYSAVSFFIFLFSPFAGDDFAYKCVFQGPQPFSDDWSDLFLWARMHRVSANARLFNLIVPALLSLDRIVLALLSAAMTALMLVYGLKLTGKAAADRMYATLFVAAMAWVLPWWDSMSIFTCQENYIWTSAIILLSLYMILNPPQRIFTLVLALGICGLGGATHEGGTLPLAVGLLAYGVIIRPRPGRSWLLAAAFFIGMLFVSLAPGIIGRAASQRLADDPLVWLALKTIPAVLVMVAVLIAMLFTAVWRERLRALVLSPYLILIVAAVASSCIALMSGIVGRSGWFAEIYALIVLFHLCGEYLHASRRIGRAVSVVVAVALLFQTAFVAVWQYFLDRENDTFVNLYTTSGEDILYMDYTAHDRLPWLLLGRYRGVPDADDVYILKTFVDYYRPGSPLPVILPHDALSVDLSAVSEAKLSNGDIIADRLPAGSVGGATLREGIPMWFFEKDGQQWLARSFDNDGRSLFLLSRRVLDPGDR